MSQTRLGFKDDEYEFGADANRKKPALWIRRLVVFNETDSSVEVIREVKFRLGLNIINTAKPDREKDGAVGHDVGKTLLTRLIRYCLGEATFARESTRISIANALPDSWVAAEFSIGDTNWVVIRPVGEDATSSHQFSAIKCDHWQDALESETTVRLKEFQELCSNELYSGVDPPTNGASDLVLPHANRSIRWVDVLAWLSRDQNCRYRRPMEWRSKYAESKTVSLHETDAGVLVRHMMGLLDHDEMKLIAKHRKLLSEKQTLETEKHSLQLSIDQTRSFLSRRLKMESDGLETDLFAQAAINKLKEQRKAQAEKRKTIDKRYGVETLIEQKDSANTADIEKNTELTLANAMLDTLEQKIRQLRNQGDASVKKAMARQANLCPGPEVGHCPLHKPKSEAEAVENFRKSQLDKREEEHGECKATIADLSVELRARKSKLETATKTLEAAQTKANAERDRLTKAISKLDIQTEEAKSLKSDFENFNTVTSDFEKKQKAVNRSRDQQRTARKDLQTRQAKLNRHLQRVFSEITKQPSEAVVKIDMNGVKVLPKGVESDSGEAIASETALCFDIACLSASVCGMGIFPRFMIHDSPREGDLEPHIYERLFHFIRQLELDAEDEPNFQYIIATTTPPPKSLNKRPYVRLTLDGRTDEGVLLKTNF